MRFYKKQKNGFTLIELLIATSIFAIVMVLALGTFSWAASYNTKLKEIRNVTNDGKFIISEIAKDVRLANGSKDLGAEGEVSFVNCTNGALDTVNCIKKPYSLSTVEENNDDLDDDGTYNYDHKTCRPANSADSNDCWNGIYILQENQNKAIIYYTEKDGKNYNLKKADNLGISSGIANLNTSDFKILNKDLKVSVKVDFYGKGGGKSRKFQPFFNIEVNSRSWNFDQLESRSRYDFQFDTEVETRDYNLI